MDKYIYEGPVMLFKTCIVDRWKAETRATSINKARCNFKYQYKKQNDLVASARIDLPGNILLVESKGEKQNGRN